MASANNKEPTESPLDHGRLLETFGYGFRRAFLCMAKQFGAPMDKAGLRQAEFATLVLLLDNGGAKQRQLAAALAIDPPNMVTLLTRLESRGLISRRRSKRDDRVRELHLTARGRKLALTALAEVDREERKGLDHLTPKERTELMRLLHKVTGPDFR